MDKPIIDEKEIEQLIAIKAQKLVSDAEQAVKRWSWRLFYGIIGLLVSVTCLFLFSAFAGALKMDETVAASLMYFSISFAAVTLVFSIYCVMALNKAKKEEKAARKTFQKTMGQK
jgi:Na+/melibiose symporter-like transporter